MVFTIVTIIFLPISFIAAFFAINFEDWGDRLTIGYVSKYMFPIGLAISFLFVAAAFLVHDISDAWKTAKKYLTGLLSKKARRKSHRQGRSQNDAPTWPPSRQDHRQTPGTASTTAYRPGGDEVDYKRRGLEGPDSERYVRRSHGGDPQYDHARLGLSPIRYGARKLSMGSGKGGTMSSWARPSFDGRRDRFSGDLERGRESSRPRMRWESAL